MNRCLHITIHEPSAAVPRRGTTYLAPRTGFDPESNTVMPQTDDPESNTVMPQTDDPEANTVMPQTDDPDQTGFLASGQGDYGAAAVTVCSCCCAGSAGQAAAAPGSSVSTPNPFVRQRDYSGFVIVRMAAGIEQPDADSLWKLADRSAPPLNGLKAVLEMAVESGTSTAQAEAKELETIEWREPPPGTLVSRPLIELQARTCGRTSPLGPQETFNTLRELEKQAVATPFPPLHSLTAYWRLDVRKRPDLLEKVMEGLNRLAEVDLAYRELVAADPEVADGEFFHEDQGYLAEAPVGISALWAWQSLAAAESTTAAVALCDLEQGWTPKHLDLKALVPDEPFCGDNRAPDEGNPGHHGTAVLGQLAATGLVKGAAADLGRFVMASHYKSKNAKEVVEGKSVPHPFAGTNGHVAAAIAQLLPDKPLGDLEAGDILLLEVQRALLPTEVDEADFDAIRLASALGVIVIEAAGNGGFDLDAYTDPDTRRTLRRGASGFRDSGAILVGAARASLPHDRAPFSNYGSRIDCFGWGETVTTCGYGDLAGTVDTDFYTNAFSGTSSAAPIIAGAAALVQALHEDQAGYLLRPREMRDLLSDPATGTPQGPNVPGFIGVMPDLKAVLRGRLQLVPDVYMRRHVGDDGSAPGPDEEISSSPDILLWNGNGQETPAERFGEGPRSNTPAPGTAIDPANPECIYPNNLHVRLRNRGVGIGEAKVQIFASPAATLITPERWMPVGCIDVPEASGGIVQGDLLTVSPALAVDLPQPGQWPQSTMEWLNAIVPFYSFLAVQLPLEGPSSDLAPGYEKTVMLPPGPPYFQWDQFRSFLRGPGVAWRNIHPVKAAAGSPITLSFLIAGTPDRTRQYDFEVIQRLPAKAEVALVVHPALAAKLRQRQPWLRQRQQLPASGPQFLDLPQRPRTTLSRVAISPGVYAHAAFEVKPQPGTLLKGHSLAIRQLWRGEEVGRITWWFVDE